MTTKVKGAKMTEAERLGLKTWFCQHDGNELEEQLASDPTGRIKDPECGQSWWATEKPDPDDVKTRKAALKKADKK